MFPAFRLIHQPLAVDNERGECVYGSGLAPMEGNIE